MEEYRSHAHSVSSCKYHFVWYSKSSKGRLCVPRGISDPAQYRHSVVDVVEDDVRGLFAEIADHFGHEILALEIADDHLHLFLQCDLKYSPADIARQFNSYSGKHLLERYPEIRESYFWGGGFWKVRYYVGTTGAVSEDVVERYIEETEHAPG